jgi:hypothetical protein
MATQEGVRRIALSLPQASQAADHFGFGVLSNGKLRGFAWAWNERIARDKPRVPNPEVLAVRVASLAEKDERSRPVRRSSSLSRTKTASRRCSSGSRPLTPANSRN